MKKLLTVHLRFGRRHTYNEHLGEWSHYTIENGNLFVSRDDGTRRCYAEGRWVGIDTRLVEA